MPELATLVRAQGKAAGGDMKVRVKLFAAARETGGRERGGGRGCRRRDDRRRASSRC